MKRVLVTGLSVLVLAGSALLSPAWAGTNPQQPIDVAGITAPLDPLATVRKLHPSLLAPVGSYGGCGQMCRTTSGASWNCPSPSGMHRPYFYDDGDCRCIYMKGKEPRCD